MSRAHEHDRDLDITTRQSESGSAPGRGARAQDMSGPTGRVPSGILMRKARDANGVQAGAEAAVARAGSSSGHALPDGLRGKFEGSLGADLAGVRVHTGAESQASASAVGARAYTLGSDIHFGAGQYDPGSAAGEHLLAHEVAHTVQQKGGIGARTQFKLEVSAPGDAFEAEADRAADAMVAGGPATIAAAPVVIAREAAPAPAAAAEPASGDPYAARDNAKAMSDAQIDAATANLTGPPSQSDVAAARATFTAMRDDNQKFITSADKEIEELAKAPDRASVFGLEADMRTRAEQRTQLQQARDDAAKLNESLQKNLQMLDDPAPDKQARAVARANASKGVYVAPPADARQFSSTATKGLTKIAALLDGGVSTKVTTAHETPWGGGESTEVKDTHQVDIGKGEYTNSQSTTTTNAGGSTTNKQSATVGLDSLTTKDSTTTIKDGKLDQSSSSTKTSYKDGRLGTETTLSGAKGSAEDGELGRGATYSATGSGGVTVGPDSVGADGGLKGTAGGQLDKDKTVSVTPGVNGKVTLTIIKDKDGKFWANLTFNLSVSVSASGSYGNGTVGVNGGPSYAHSGTRTIKIPLEESEVAAYQSEFTAGGGAKPGLNYVKVLADHGDQACADMLDGGAKDSKIGMDHETSDTIGADGGVSVGPAGVTAGVSKSDTVTTSYMPSADGKTVIASVMIKTNRTTSGGATVKEGAAGGGMSLSDSSGGGTGAKFEMPNDPALKAELDQIKTPEELQAFIASHATKVTERDELETSGTGLDTSWNVGPAGVKTSQAGEFSENEVRDDKGNVIRTDISGMNHESASLQLGDTKLWDHKNDSGIAGSIDDKNHADMNIEESDTASSHDSADPTKLKYETTISGTKVTENELDHIANLADGDIGGWMRAVGGDADNAEEWRHLKPQVQACNHDPKKVAETLAHFTASIHGGRATVLANALEGDNHGVDDFGQRYQWPEEIKQWRPRYDAIIAPQVLDDIRQTARQGTDKAIAMCDDKRKEAQAVLAAIANVDFPDASRRSEMTRRLGQRGAELSSLRAALADQTKRAAASQRREDDLNHGLDTENHQSFQPAIAPQPQSFDDCAPVEQTSTEADERAEKLRKVNEVRDQRNSLIDTCIANRDQEGKDFAVVREELAKKSAVFSNPDYDVITAKLNGQKAAWKNWDSIVEKIRSTSAEAQLDPSEADMHAPDRATWNDLYGQAFGGY